MKQSINRKAKRKILSSLWKRKTQKESKNIKSYDLREN